MPFTPFEHATACPTNPFRITFTKCLVFRYGGKGVRGFELNSLETHAMNCAGIIISGRERRLCTRCGHFAWRLPLHKLTCVQDRKAKPSLTHLATPKDRNTNSVPLGAAQIDETVQVQSGPSFYPKQPLGKPTTEHNSVEGTVRILPQTKEPRPLASLQRSSIDRIG